MILFILAVIVGAAFAWLAGVFAWAADDWQDAAVIAVPCAAIAVCIWVAAGLGIGGVLA